MWKYINFSERCWVFCSLTKTNTLPQMMKIVPNPKQNTFSGCLVFLLKFPENQKISTYAVLTEGESIINICILHQFQQVSKSHFFLI